MKLRWAVFMMAMLAAGAVLSCPTCKDALGNTPQSAGMARGFYHSILTMLGVVFSLVGILVFRIVKEARKETSAPPAG